MPAAQKQANRLEPQIKTARGDSRIVAGLLNASGYKSHLNIQARLGPVYQSLGIRSKYSFCIAEALGWAEYGQTTASHYHEILVSYFDGKTAEKNVAWSQLAGRYGDEKLADAARAYLRLQPYVPDALLRGIASATQMLEFQNRARDLAIDFAKQNRLQNFGSWLFCGPIKILAILTPTAWVPEMNDVAMPLGSPVIRAFKMLANSGVHGINQQLFKVDASGLAGSAFGTLYIAHAFEKELAGQSTGALALHINTGLHHLGGGMCA